MALPSEYHKEPYLLEEYEQLTYFLRTPSSLAPLHNKGITRLFPIQYHTFDAIQHGNDLIGRDRTGSGKTIAYALPVIERFRQQHLFHTHTPKYLIILPTRELAIQVTNEIDSLKIHPN